MESGLRGRNNPGRRGRRRGRGARLNGVRPKRPEQSDAVHVPSGRASVSMESGLRGRNNCPPKAL